MVPEPDTTPPGAPAEGVAASPSSPPPATNDGADADAQASTASETVTREKHLPGWLRRKPATTPEAAAADRISKQLGERASHPCLQIRRVARVLGLEKLEQLYQQTLEIEAQGGLLLPEANRRRTPGGVFFLLVGEQVDDEQFALIFGRDHRRIAQPRIRPEPGQALEPMTPWQVKQLRTTRTNAPGRPSTAPLPLPLPPPGERSAMTVPGKLELTLKINALPEKTHTDKNGWKIFWVACGDHQVEIKLRPKFFTKLTEAAAQWPRWGAALSGQLGPVSATGFELLNASVKVFEVKEKGEPAAAPGAPPKAE